VLVFVEPELHAAIARRAQQTRRSIQTVVQSALVREFDLLSPAANRRVDLPAGTHILSPRALDLICAITAQTGRAPLSGSRPFEWWIADWTGEERPVALLRVDENTGEPVSLAIVDDYDKAVAAYEDEVRQGSASDLLHFLYEDEVEVLPSHPK
jgi:hypothetical protein